MDKNREIYVSCDVETDGPVPGRNSMISLGAAAIGWDGTWRISHTFSRNLQQLPNACMDGKTWDTFWSKNPEAWKAATANAEQPSTVMSAFSEFLKEVQTSWNRRPIAVGAPSVFDLAFVRYYMISYLGTDQPLGRSGYDMRSVASVLFGTRYSDTGKRNYPKEWFNGSKHTHIAVDDATEQAWIWSHIVDTDYEKQIRMHPLITVAPVQLNTRLRMK